MYLGRICEPGPAERVFAPPYHPYTEALLSAMPVPDPEAGSHPDPAARVRCRALASRPPAVRSTPAARARSMRSANVEVPPAREGPEGHTIVCHIPLPDLAALQSSVLPGPDEHPPIPGHARRIVGRSLALAAAQGRLVSRSGRPFPTDMKARQR